MPNTQQVATIGNSNVQPARTFEELTVKEKTLAREMGLDFEIDIDERLSQVIYKTNDALRLAVEAGLFLISIKADCAHGEFGKRLEHVGISRQRAAEMMNMARVTASLPTAQRKNLLTLPKNKALLLAKTDPEIIHEVLDGEFDDINQLSYQDMRLRLRDMESKTADLETQLDTSKVEQEELRNLLKKQRAGSDYPDFVVVTRSESDALTQKTFLCLDDLARLVDDLTRLQNQTVSDELHNYMQMSATTLLVHLNAINAKASQTIKQLIEGLPVEYTQGQVSASFLYSDSEIDHAVSERSLLTREHEQEKAIRHNEREASKPKGRGRPRKDAQ